MKSETHHQRADVGQRLGHRIGNRLVTDRICCLGGHILKSVKQIHKFQAQNNEVQNINKCFFFRSFFIFIYTLFYNFMMKIEAKV